MMNRRLMSRTAIVAFLLAGAIPGQAQNEAASTLLFDDVTDTHVPVSKYLHALDVALVDVDGDGDLDAVLAVEMGPNRLYINDGQGRFTWKQGALGTKAHDTEHVLSADFNRDGYPDLIFVAEEDHAHQLFLGGPGGVFTEASDRLPKMSEGNGLAIGDVNGDGLPDIVIGNSAEDRPGKPRASAQNFLWLNDPKQPGTFIDATATHLPAYEDDTQDIALADVDGDGDLDMVIANESPPNRLLLNDGKGRFREASKGLQLLTPMETREVHVFDANGDGRPDILFLNLTSNNKKWDKDPQARLLINKGRGKFRDETKSRLPANRFSSWGGMVMDFNHDGHPDLVVGAIDVPGFKPLQLRAYANDGKGRFSDVTAAAMPTPTVGRSWSMAKGDVNGDGVEDLFVGAWGTQARLLLGRKAK
ncbi:FG-GAP repeat [Sphingobium herbicidovorans NBRC 16415]|uniref:FG-GAP repeat n=1 Tax=Sphingobium herbicidovorans (strain ATCC 700291 / DSM 11019 / CCUG 56400 / KCTC 2939 / LMG 18315 / NBRC 16415 / MH) TaxID=1219045 RepID=A0A086PEV6_SPHHM|nr:VCBS repeat-containing protein [Sphingobium herbicidovorans]KFG91924.1 FG-GAP repeat [Sphingobium herbicidovorans NBRC 16415]